MSEFTTAETARKMTKAAKSSKKTNEIIKTVVEVIEQQAMKGDDFIIIESNCRTKNHIEIDSDVKNRLKQLGYVVEEITVTRNNFDNHNKPFEADVVKVSW